MLAKNNRADSENRFDSAEASGRNKKKNRKKTWRQIRVGVFVFLFSMVFLVVSGISAVSLIVKHNVLDRYLGSINRGDGSFNDKNIIVHEGLSGQVKNIALFGVKFGFVWLKNNGAISVAIINNMVLC